MAMARNLLQRYDAGYGGLYLDARWESSQEKAPIVSGLMAEEAREEATEGKAATTTSTSTSSGAFTKVGEDEHTLKGSTWLQLGIVSRPVELNLFPERPTVVVAAANNRSPLTTSHNFVEFTTCQPPGSSGLSVGSARELRVVSPPRRRQTGVWFELRAAGNRGKEPFLPQIPKGYLRIKDGSMTVGLLMKYLVNKLGLDDETKVDITCRGQLLHPVLTLHHIRDHIWCTMSRIPVMPQDLQITDHVMTLIYSRRA